MKITVAAMGNQVAGHFGHCENFIFFDTADGKITAVNTVANPGHRPGFLPNFLADNGTQVIISGGMGGGAVDIFNERGVEVVVGVQGDAQTAVETYLKGELVSSGSICHQHKHAHKCGKHN
ncbi:MAG: NifB/NifX family molybdenum-iron cluster-binding protein [Clostridia bacterium]|nr:NifB/NifX family molybdenum-iron cluster-binding protein [Clostridia bacterium]